MPNKARNQRHALAEERRLRAQAEERLAQTEARLQACNGYASAPIFRPGSLQYDWHCECGHVNFAGRMRCHAQGCNIHRQRGATIVGQIRGRVQETAQARDDFRRHQVVPAVRCPTVRVQPRSSTTGRQVQQTRTPTVAELRTVGLQRRSQPQAVAHDDRAKLPVRSYAQVAQASTRVPAQQLAQTDATASGQQQLTQGDNAVGIAAQEEHDPNDEVAGADGDFEDDASVTLQEDADASTLQRRLRGLDKRRRKQLARIEKQEETVRAKKEEIALQQAQLVELQASADEIRDKLRETDEITAELSSRLAELTAQRVKNEEHARADAEVQQNGTAQEARQCLLGALHGLQTFTEQPPEFQLMLRQFAAAVEAMQQAEIGRNGRQQGPSHEPGASVPTEVFDIHSNSSTLPGSSKVVQPECGESQQVDMDWAKTQGEKRKIDSVEEEERGNEKRAALVLLALTDAPADEVDQIPSEFHGTDNGPNRKEYLASLQARVSEQAAKAPKHEAQTEARSTPYGHG